MHTSVGPIASSIFSCGHCTTVQNGNMYSFLTMARLGRIAQDDGRPQVVAALLLDQPRPVFGGHVVDAGLLEVGVDVGQTPSACPGTVKAARADLGSSGGSGCTGPMRSASASAISFVCRDAQMPEQLMQPRPLLTKRYRP